VIRVGGVPQPERHCDSERHEQRGAVEEAREPAVDAVDGPEQEIEAERSAIAACASIGVMRPAGWGIVFGAERGPRPRVVSHAETEAPDITTREHSRQSCRPGGPPNTRTSRRSRAACSARPPQITAKPTPVSVAAKTEAEGDDQDHAEADPGCWEIAAIKDHERGGAWHDPARDAQPDRLRIVIGPSGVVVVLGGGRGGRRDAPRARGPPAP